jgi:hypothetical protein
MPFLFLYPARSNAVEDCIIKFFAFVPLLYPPLTIRRDIYGYILFDLTYLTAFNLYGGG